MSTDLPDDPLLESIDGEILPVDDKVLRADEAYMNSLFEKAGDHQNGMSIDLSDDRQFNFLKNRLASQGITPETAPGVYKVLRDDRLKSLSGLQEKNVDPCGNFGIVTGNPSSPAAQAMASCFGGHGYMYLDTNLQDSTGRTASQFVEDFGNKLTLELKTTLDPSIAATLPKACGDENAGCWVTCNSTVAALTAAGSSYKYFVCSTVSNRASLEMSHPRDFHATPTEGGVRVCLNREWLTSVDAEDCDYLHSTVAATCPTDSICDNRWVKDGSVNGNHVIAGGYVQGKLYVPVKGGAGGDIPDYYDDGASFPSVEGIIASQSVPTVLEAKAWLTLDTVGAVTPGGGICNPVDLDLASCVTFEDLGPGFTNHRQYGVRMSCVPQFGNATWESHCLDNHQAVDLNVLVVANHKVLGGDQQYSWHWRMDRNAPHMDFQWGCLPKGTRVSLPGGRTSFIEDMQSGDTVLSAMSQELFPVTRMMTGVETSELVQIEDELGHRLSMTKEHPIPLVSGTSVMAHELREGDLIWTEQGVARIVSVELVAYEGAVYNLEVDNGESTVELPSTMFANGILVGDARMQEALSLQRYEQKRASMAAPTIPEYLRKDYEGSLVRKVQAAKRASAGTHKE
jgi:hypothetical protein